MTDSAKTAIQPGSYRRTSGYGAGAGEDTRMAANSGRASARPHRPGAASPAGWFPPPAGEAAPPVRHREPARSDGASAYAVETRPTSMYRVPWQSARANRARHPVRRPQPPTARPQRATDHDGHRGSREAASPGRRGRTCGRARPTCAGHRSPGRRPGTFPSSARPRRCAAGPTGPAWTRRAARSPACSTHEQESGWQLAQRVWQDSGVDWEAAAPEPNYDRPDPYAAQQYSAVPNPEAPTWRTPT